MYIFDFIGNLFSSDSENSCAGINGGIEINPGSGLPMCGPGIDIEGNMYGMTDTSFETSTDWMNDSI